MTDDPGAGKLDPRFSAPHAKPSSWADARSQIETAKTYWLATVRADGRPHVTTIAAVWVDEIIHFVTGPTEQKAKNLAAGNKVAVITGASGWEGLDVVIEGEAVELTDVDRLQRIVDAFTEKYDDTFEFRVRDGGVHVGDSPDQALAFEVVARKVFAFAKGEQFSQTRWRFAQR